MMIPCIKDKCLKYPICLAKKDIECQDLLDYYEDMHDRLLDKDDHDTTQNTWDETCDAMCKQFLNLIVVRGPNPYKPGYRMTRRQRD